MRVWIVEMFDRDIDKWCSVATNAYRVPSDGYVPNVEGAMTKSAAQLLMERWAKLLPEVKFRIAKYERVEK